MSKVPGIVRGILSFDRRIGFPTTLAEIGSIGRPVSEKIPQAAKDSQLESRLPYLPVALSADRVDQSMGPAPEAAWSGDLTKIVMRE
jgi:hypothetical protein